MGSYLFNTHRTMFPPDNHGLKKESKIWFVDGDHGQDGNSEFNGRKPERAFKSVGYALARMVASDVLYVLERDWITSEPNPYVEGTANITVPVSNIAIVGMPSSMGVPLGVQIKGVGALTTAIVTVSSKYNVNFENMAFGKALIVDASGPYLVESNGCTFYNCDFKNFRGSAGATTTGAGVHINGGWNNNIVNSWFRDCRCGVQLRTGTSTVKWTVIEGCNFLGTPASRDCDIYMTGGPFYCTYINGCNFGPFPTYAGVARFVSLLDDGIISNSSFSGAAALTYGSTGTAALIPTTFYIAHCSDDNGDIART